MKPRAIIVDLDGVLAILNRRDPYDASTCEKDEVNALVKELVAYFKHEGYAIIISTGRMDTWRNQTLSWLMKNNIDLDVLQMRPEAKRSLNMVVLKEDWLMQEFLPKYNVKLALEDSWRLADMYRFHDIPCWQIDKDPFYK